MQFIAGFTLGFLGSVHCIGMCGPLALALPFSSHGGRPSYYSGRLLYNLGRVVTYAILGVAVGFLGRMLSLAGWQQGLSLLAGVVIVLIVALPGFVHRFTAKFSRITRLSDFIQGTISALFQRRSASTLFLVGLVNGLLPCGFVYVGLAGAAATGEPLLASLFMAGFGLGTVPAMFGVALAGRLMRPSMRRRFRVLAPALTLIVAGLIIVRGLNLGIPYISPKFSATSPRHDTEPECCH